MVRVTIEIVPMGIESRKRPIGLIEIGKTKVGNGNNEEYNVILKKSFPWKGALIDTWKKAILNPSQEDEETITGKIEGFNNIKRGPYDLLFRALKACGIDKRNC